MKKIQNWGAWTVVLLGISVFLTVCPAHLMAQEGTARPKVALVLSGGGARGAAHTGVIQVLEELHVPIDYVVGTSMGSIIGGLYAIGTPPDEIVQLATKLDWQDIFNDKSPRPDKFYRTKADHENYLLGINIDNQKGLTIPTGLISGKKLDITLRTLTLGAGEDFDTFPIPFRAVATDVETGEMVVLGKGDLTRSLRASMAIPAAFSPVEINGHLLVDGGVARNLPIDVGRALGADVVIAVNIGTPLAKRDKLQNFLAVTDQTTSFLTNRNVNEQIKTLQPGDILLTPDLGDITTGSFKRMDEAVAIGRNAALNAAESLKRYAVSPEEYALIRQNQLKACRRPGKIDFYEIKNKEILNSDFVSGYLKRRIEKAQGKPPDADNFAQTIFELSDRADLENINFKLIERGGKQGLLLEPKGKEHLQHNINIGLELSNDFEGHSIYDMLLEYTMTHINSLGAEWKNQLQFGEERRYFSEFYQPLATGAWRFFLSPYVSYDAKPLNVYSHTKRIAEYERDNSEYGVDFGLQLAEYGEMRLGVLGGEMKTNLETGDPSLPEDKFHNGAYKASLVIDQLDSTSAPRTGVLMRSEFIAGRSRLGADESYNFIKVVALKPFSIGRNTLVVRGRWESMLSSTSNEAEELNQVSFLGGFLNLSGLAPDQLYGQQLAFGELIYTFRLLKEKVFGNDLYMGASYEAGNVWQNRSDVSSRDLVHAGSVFFGADSLIGPVYLGYGHAEGGYDAVYFIIGFSF